MHRKNFIRSVVGGVLSVLGTQEAFANRGYWEGVIRESAAIYGADGDWLVSTCECESGFDPGAVGDMNVDGSGPDTGLFQFSPATWAEMTGYMGIYGDIWNGHDQCLVAAWCFANGYACRWVCSGCFGG